MWLFSPFPMGGRTFTKRTVRNTSFGQQPRTANLLETFVHEIELKDRWTELDALFHNDKLRGSSGWEHGGRLGSCREGGMHLCTTQASRLAFLVAVKLFKPQ